MFESRYQKYGDAENKPPIGTAWARVTVDAYGEYHKGDEDAGGDGDDDQGHADCDDARTRMGSGEAGG